MRNISIKSIALVSVLALGGISSNAMANEAESKKELESSLQQQVTQQSEQVAAELQKQLEASLKLAIARFVPELPSSTLAKTH